MVEVVMAKWAVYGAVTATKYLGVVEADTVEEAEEKGWALDTCSVSVCHRCSEDVGDPDIGSLVIEKETA